MKRYIPKSNNWIATRIVIDIITIINDVSVSASTSVHGVTNRDQFINKLVDDLFSLGYFPRMDVNTMKRELHSPHSESEYYTFLKWNDKDRRNKFKVILDFRFSEHDMKEWSTKYSAADRHKHHMRTKLNETLSMEFNIPVQDVEVVFHDIIEDNLLSCDIIKIDGKLCNNYSEAYDIMQQKLAELP